MNLGVEAEIRKNLPWEKLPQSVQQQLGNSQKEYEKCVITFSVKNQIRFRGNLIQYVKKDEKKYYQDLLDYSRKSLMLFPYHLSDVIIKGLQTTPFQYYVTMLETLMLQERSYDSLPNFTAADCLRLLGIGRNQYIELMNQSRSSKKLGGFFRTRNCRELLPSKPVSSVNILPWWIVQIGYITEDDMKNVDKYEHTLIDQIIDKGSCPAGHLNRDTVFSLYLKGLIYFDVPISENDYVIVPPLEGFVMNRVLGDFLETLMYKIFVSIDENTTVSELASVLEIDASSVQDAVSVYCRLGFAKKKNSEMDSNDIHPTWCDHLDTVVRTGIRDRFSVSSDEDDSLLRELNLALESEEAAAEDSRTSALQLNDDQDLQTTHNHIKKIGFLFDSTLTAYLMMGNLSPGLKNHAVTMFEVGKLSDESLDSLVTELEKVSTVEGEGEAARYFSHALTLRETIMFLRHNEKLKNDSEEETDMCLGLDLIRCESLQSLDPSTASRLLNKNYSLLVSMAPLINEIRPLSDSVFPPHLGPPIPEVSSVWFKLFLYHLTGHGPPSLLLAKGTRLRRLPPVFRKCSRFLITTWGHDPTEIPISGAITMLMDALQHSPILVQIYSKSTDFETVSHTVPFPLSPDDQNHPVIKELKSKIDIEHSCGYITFLDLKKEKEVKINVNVKPENEEEESDDVRLLAEEVDNIDHPMAGTKARKANLKLMIPGSTNRDISLQEDWTFLDLNFGLPLFDADLNKSVCERIIARSLWKSDSLEQLRTSSEKLCKDLLGFIEKFQDIPPSMKKFQDKFKSDEVAYPTKNLIFLDGKLTEWKDGVD